MTLIHTTDDLIRLLNENDEFRQAVRRHVLSDELIQLPERLAKFETRVESFIDEQQQFNKEQRQFNQRMESSIGELRDTVAQHTDTIGELRDTVAQHTDAIGELRDTVAQHTDTIGELRDTVAQQGKAINRQTDAIGELRGKVARQVVGVHFLEIADGMGFLFKGFLSRLDLGQLIFQRETDIPQNDRRSFFRADLVIEVTDSDDAIHYIAVEASYTADERDTSRAQRNATILTQLTGHPAHAAIASVRNVHEIQVLIDDGTVYWYALEPNDFTPE